MILRALPDAEVKRAFGDPAQFIHADGTVDPAWEDLILGSASLPAPLPLSWDASKQVTHFRCHRKLARIFTETLRAVHGESGAWPTVNDFGGCYAWRPQRGSKALSRHCWGIAIDMDVNDNPMGRSCRVDPRVVAIMEAHGFAWGGNFLGARIDPMHFEFADLSKLGGA